MSDEHGQRVPRGADDDRLPAGIDSVFPPILLIVFGALLVHAALGYGETGRQLPVLIGTITVLLALLDLVSRLPGLAGGWLRRALGAGFRDREMKHAPKLVAEITQFAWLAACVAAIVLIGFLAAVPLFIFMYTWLQGRQPLLASAVTAIAVVLLTGLVFEVLLDYELYRGLLFGGRD
jgi:hypothetical protein